MSGDLLTLAPLITVIVGAIAVLVSDMITPNRNHAPVAVALAALGGTAALLINQGGSSATALGGSYVAGPFVAFLGLLGISIVAITLFVKRKPLQTKVQMPFQLPTLTYLFKTTEQLS
jgi:hypothetical protein